MLRTMTVEDNLLFREMFKGNLLSEFPSMEIIEAANGEEAFKRLSSNAIDLVFMDIRLPGESGLELTRKMNLPAASSGVSKTKTGRSIRRKRRGIYPKRNKS